MKKHILLLLISILTLSILPAAAQSRAESGFQLQAKAGYSQVALPETAFQGAGLAVEFRYYAPFSVGATAFVAGVKAGLAVPFSPLPTVQELGILAGFDIGISPVHLVPYANYLMLQQRETVGFAFGGGFEVRYDASEKIGVLAGVSYHGKTNTADIGNGYSAYLGIALKLKKKSR